MLGYRNKPTERGTLTFWRRQRPGRDLSGHGKKSTEQGTLTNWIQQKEGLVRTWTQKESEGARRTHTLEATDGGLVRTRKEPTERNTLTNWRRQRGGTCQDTERNRPIEPHSPTGDGRERALSGHRMKLAKQGTLTNWRRQREELVRTWKEIERASRTHILKMAEGGTCQDIERTQSSEEHPQPGESRGRDLSGHRNKPINQGTLTFWRWQRPRRDLSGHGKKSTEQGTLTNWIQQREGFVRTRTQKESERGALTSWRRQTEDLSGHGKS